MTRKWMFVAVMLCVQVGLNGFGNAALAQDDCEDCDCPRCRCASKWSCLWGKMVSNGYGGTFRIYGYPPPPCCSACPRYPAWGMGCACPRDGRHPERRHHWASKSRSQTVETASSNTIAAK